MGKKYEIFKFAIAQFLHSITLPTIAMMMIPSNEHREK